jgi:hypothetical protein
MTVIRLSSTTNDFRVMTMSPLNASHWIDILCPRGDFLSHHMVDFFCRFVRVNQIIVDFVTIFFGPPIHIFPCTGIVWCMYLSQVDQPCVVFVAVCL